MKELKDYTDEQLQEELKRRTKRGYESFDMDKARIVEIIKA